MAPDGKWQTDWIHAASDWNVQELKTLHAQHPDAVDIVFGRTALFAALDRLPDASKSIAPLLATIRYLLKDLSASQHFRLPLDNASCLMRAVENIKRADVVELLLEHDVSAINEKSHMGFTPLTYALFYGLTDIAKALLAKGARTDILDDQQMSPLHRAACHGHDAVAVIVDHALPFINTGDDKGRTPVVYAIRNGHLDAVSLLHARGADLELRDNLGRTALLQVDINRLKMMQHLDSLGANFHAKDDNEDGLLHILARSDTDTGALEFALTKGLSIDAPNKEKRSPLFSAVMARRLDKAAWLLEHGAKVDEKDVLGRTPMMYACADGQHSDLQRDFVHILLKNGANPCETDFEGKSMHNHMQGVAVWDLISEAQSTWKQREFTEMQEMIRRTILGGLGAQVPAGKKLTLQK